MHLKVETITPAKAAKYLTSNKSNQRHISSSHVKKMAVMMVNKEFDGMNGQTIKFNGGGKSEVLIDGQHRLMAIVESQIPQKIPVLRGCSSEAFETIDNNQKSRTIENYYQIYNQGSPKLSAQVARWVYNYETFGGKIIKTPDITSGHLAKWAMEHHPDIPAVLDPVTPYCSHFAKSRLGTKPHLGFAYYMWHKVDPILAYEIAMYIGSNEGRVPPVIHALKQFLIDDVPREGNRVLET